MPRVWGIDSAKTKNDKNLIYAIKNSAPEKTCEVLRLRIRWQGQLDIEILSGLLQKPLLQNTFSSRISAQA